MKNAIHKLFLQLKIAFFMLIALTLVTGVIYPAIVTVIAQNFFAWQANGSMIVQDNKVIGSALIGQSFTKPEYFWGRPSATSSFPYNAFASGGSNLGPSNAVLWHDVKTRVAQVKVGADPALLIPVDLVTTSASGLDPDISPYAAFYQVDRIAKARHLEPQVLIDLINSQITARTLGILGEPRINVLALNIALDKLRSAHGRAPSKSR